MLLTRVLVKEKGITILDGGGKITFERIWQTKHAEYCGIF